jgi:hypothetical protein
LLHLSGATHDFLHAELLSGKDFVIDILKNQFSGKQLEVVLVGGHNFGSFSVHSSYIVLIFIA